MNSTAVFLSAADEDDLEALLSIERRSYTHPWSLRGFRQALRPPGRVVALRTGSPADARGIRAYAAYEIVLDELHLHNLAVHPDHRGEGLGRRLLGLVLDLSARAGARTAFLETRPSNAAALRLYRAAGFRAISVRRDYYDRPREDALILQKTDLVPHES